MPNAYLDNMHSYINNCPQFSVQVIVLSDKIN